MAAAQTGPVVDGQFFSSKNCATEHWPATKPIHSSNICRFEGTRTVAYGNQGKFVTRTATGSVNCSNAVFGDPLPGKAKRCHLNVVTLTSPSQPASTPVGGGSTAAAGNAAAKAAADKAAADKAAKALAAQQTAMLLWRNDLPAKHPKGSCASCHGADFFDLARIGSTDADIVRRALIDGATPDEAEALRQAVLNMRQSMKLPTTNPRTFRPFQPGGQILLPQLQEAQWNIAAVKRDIAFAENVSTLLPTFYGTRIATLAQAQKARDEMLDIARGSNSAGANPKATQLRDLPVGLDYPLWSADKFHGAKEGTLNDWVSDLGFVPKPGRKVEWQALENAYLARPANDTFWVMYSAVDGMLELATPLGNCNAQKRFGGSGVASIHFELCGRATGGFKHKFKSALIGQHMMRMDALGRRNEFVNGPIGFAYLDLDPQFRSVPKENWGGRSMLPSDLWEIGDALGRTTIGSLAEKTLGEGTAALGLPAFVVDSVDVNRTITKEEQELRLPWMWIGFTFDPSFARIAAGNPARVAEYMVGTLLDAKLFNHNAFMTHMRLMASTYLPEASTTGAKTSTGVSRVANDRLHEVINYSYFLAYGRNLMGAGYDGWAESVKHGGAGPVPQTLKDRSAQLWSTQVSNGMRTGLLLLLDEVQKRPQGLNKAWLTETAREIQKATPAQWRKDYREHWAKFQPEHSAADTALLNQVAQAIVQAAGI
jgi:hypothetical protein